MKNEIEHLRKIATPSAVLQTIGQELLGEPYVVYPFIAYAEQKIIDAVMDTSHERYLLFNAPPQTGKSLYAGIGLPFWLTGMFPNWPGIYISYSDDFSVNRGKDVRALHQAYGKDLFGTAIDPDFSSAGDWRIMGHRGGMLSVGIGSQITGRPGMWIVIDDLIKNAEEAASVATKRKHLAEWDGTIARRLQPGGTVIAIATRWAEDDLSGMLQARMKEPGYEGPQWEVVEFPAFAEPPDDVELTAEEEREWRDVLGRRVGEVLDCRFSRIPGRAPESFFNLAKASMDPFSWSCLYQQRPSVREGGMFPKERWGWYHPGEEPEMEQVIRVWDLAATEGGGDWTVGEKWGRGVDGKFYVLDVRRFRRSAGDVEVEVLRTAQEDGHSVPVVIEQERAGAGKALIESYKSKLTGFYVYGVKAEGSKESRAVPYSAEQNKGNVLLPVGAPWVKEFVDEHKRMMGDGRRPRHDDQIDCGSYAVIELLGSGGCVALDLNGLNFSAERQMRLLLEYASR